MSGTIKLDWKFGLWRPRHKRGWQPPPIITKYFKKEDLEWYQQGSLRFGTLADYAASENAIAQGARLDPSENTIVRKLTTEGEIAKSFTLKGIEVRGDMGVDLADEELVTEFDAYVMCFSNEQYSTDRHDLMMYGDDGLYPGDDRLIGSVSYDTRKLAFALAVGLSEKFQIPIQNNEVGFLCLGDCDYDDSIRVLKVTSGMDGEREFQNAAVTKTFTKPRQFSVESEVRFLFSDADVKDRPHWRSPFSIHNPLIKLAECSPPKLMR